MERAIKKFYTLTNIPVFCDFLTYLRYFWCCVRHLTGCLHVTIYRPSRTQCQNGYYDASRNGSL